MCLRLENICFHKVHLSDAQPPETDFMMTLSSILEPLLEPSLITFSLLVAPVANAGMFFESKFPSHIHFIV